MKAKAQHSITKATPPETAAQLFRSIADLIGGSAPLLTRTRAANFGFFALLALLLNLALPLAAKAGIAYGTLNNFDCVNDTGVEAQGRRI